MRSYTFLKSVKNQILAIDSEKGLSIFSIHSNKLMLQKRIEFDFDKDESFRTFEFVESRNQIVIGRKNGIVRFIDYETLNVQLEIKLPLSDDYFLGWGLDILALSSDEKWLTVGQTWYTAYPIKLESKETKEISIPAQPLFIRYSNDTNYIGIIHGEQGGCGLAIYQQSEIGDWHLQMEKWGVDNFAFSQDSRNIYTAAVSESNSILITSQSIDGQLVFWQKEFRTKNNVEYSSKRLKLFNNNLILIINETMTTIDSTNGEPTSKKEYSNIIQDIIFFKDNFWVATSNGIECAT